MSIIYPDSGLQISYRHVSATGRIDSETRTPRMYALTAVLATPLVAFKERNFRAARGNFTWSTLSTVCSNFGQSFRALTSYDQFCHWFERDARPKLPGLLQDLEHFMWLRIRNYIWEQYTTQPADAHAFSFKVMARDILAKASVCMIRLGYERHITPLLSVCQFRPRWISIDPRTDLAHPPKEHACKQHRDDSRPGYDGYRKRASRRTRDHG